MMMSRELKLALILGFAAVMVVGVLLSDHMSGARKARIEERSLQSPQLALRPPTTGDYAVREPEPAAVEGTLPDASDTAFAQADPPATISMGEPLITEPMPETLADAAQGRSNALDDFLAWSERQGVRFDNIGAATPLVETRPKQTPGRTLPDTAPPPVTDQTIHTVRENETLWGIAERYYGDGTKHALIERANQDRIGRSGALYVGAELIIPPGEVAPTRPAPQATRSETAPAPTPRYHTVKKGETLGEIARATLGSSKRWPEIVKLNPRDLADPDKVPVGARLKLPPQ